MFSHDLSKFLVEQMDDGNQIILMGDFNSDYKLLCDWIMQFDLTDTIANQHGPCPITYNRSRKDPLDVMFTSLHIKSLKSHWKEEFIDNCILPSVIDAFIHAFILPRN